MSVLVVGDVMTDRIVVPEGPLVRGSDRRATIRSHPGGSGANQAVWLVAHRVPVRFAARVGAGDVARLTVHFAERGVEAHLAADPDLPSGELVTILDPDGERSFLTDRGANLNLSPADLSPSLLEGVQLVLASGYSFFAPGPRAAVQNLFIIAANARYPTAIDPASTGFLAEVGPATFLDWTQGTHWCFANEAEAAMLSGSSDLATQVRTLGKHYRTVVIKRGAQGAILGDAAGIRHVLPAPTVSVLDSTGAGDAFAAGFIASYLAHSNEETALASGIAAGSRAVQHLGGQP